MPRVVVVGGGAAGMMAAVEAGRAGADVVLLEKMPALGRKLSITGKGRCNLTNNADRDQIIANLPGNGQFLYSALTAFGAADTIAFIEALGVPTKTERGGRVFPVSDRAADVVAAFRRELNRLGVEVRLRTPAASLVVQDGAVTGVKLGDGVSVPAAAAIITTGGASYPGTGSTGDGYRMAAAVGHTIITPRPSLVPLETVEEWPAEAQGLALKNVRVRAYASDGSRLGEEFGEMLFTHFGVSGPCILTLSRSVTAYLERDGRAAAIAIDLKPALSDEELDLRLQRDFGEYSRKHFSNALDDLLPRKLIPVIVRLSGIGAERPVHQITRSQRLGLVALLKELRLNIRGPRPLTEAIVTAGGVATREVDPRTFASKLVRGLYFAGEVLDVDGFTGGYNLQAAWASGRAAGRAAAAQ
ncbi:MAG: NAD(P)/FAD-dependent oxidoreductase [Chloroflexota bacterium]